VSEINYRLGRVADAAEIRNQIWQGRTGYPLSETYLSDMKFEEDIRHQCARRSIRVAELDHRILGVMTMRANEVYYLAIDEAVRRRGIARSLIFLAKKKWSHLEAKVRDDNASMVSLLLSEGFVVDRLMFCKVPGWSGYRWSRRGEMAKLGQA